MNESPIWSFQLFPSSFIIISHSNKAIEMSGHLQDNNLPEFPPQANGKMKASSSTEHLTIF